MRLIVFVNEEIRWRVGERVLRFRAPISGEYFIEGDEVRMEVATKLTTEPAAKDCGDSPA